MVQPAVRVAFLIPSGVGTGYTGPGIFLKRLIAGSEGLISPVIYAGLMKGHAHDPDFMPKRWMNFSDTNWLEQLKWAVRSFIWLIGDRKEYDVAHFHGTFIFKLVGAIACIILQKPFILVPLSADADIAEKGKLSGNPFIKPLRKEIVKRAAHGFALGESIADEMTIAGLPKDRITIIQNPVSSEFFGAANPVRFEKKQLVFIGIVGERKRAILVLEVLAELISRGIEAECSFYGPFQDNAYQLKFDDKIREFHLESHVNHFEFSNEISHILLDSASLFILPSSQEGIPGALVESIAAGVPCIVTDAGAMAETIHAAGAGRVVEPSAKMIADACADFLFNQSKWECESAKLRNFAIQNLSSKSVGKKYTQVICNLI